MEARCIVVLRMLGIRDLHACRIGRKTRILLCSKDDGLVDNHDGDVELETGNLREKSGMNH